MQTRDDALILYQIKTVRSDRSGRQSSWSCWINEALASFHMPGFWMTRLLIILLFGAVFINLLCTQSQNSTLWYLLFSPQLKGRSVYWLILSSPWREVAAFSRKFQRLLKISGMHGSAEGESSVCPSVRLSGNPVQVLSDHFPPLTTWASALCTHGLALNPGSAGQILLFTPIPELLFHLPYQVTLS